MLKKILKNNAIYILFGLLMIFLLLVDTAGYNIKIQYGETPEYGHFAPPVSGVMVTSKDTGVVSEEEVANDRYYYGTIASSQWTRSKNHIDIIISRQNETISSLPIEKIEFRFLFFNLLTVTKDNFVSYIQPSGNSFVDNNYLVIPFEENVAGIHFESSNLIDNSHVKEKADLIKAGLCIFIVLLIILFCLFDYKCKTYDDAIHYKWVVVLGIILFLIILSVNHGTQYCSPDEDVSAGAVRYYYDHWGLPNFNDDSVVETFSIYGSSRLKELTPYYFLAGKVGVIVKNTIGVAFPYRYLNLLLFVVLVGLFIKYGKNNKWMLFGLICTPQLYYIFTYTTSDAWDYFISYICIMYITYTIHNRKRNDALNPIVMGILLALIFMGKSTYYSVILYVAGVYAIKLFCTGKADRKKIIKNSLTVLIVFTAIVLARKGIDYLYYGGNKKEILKTMGTALRTYFYISYRERGTSLYGMITDTNLCDRLFKSFYGVYGWMRFEGVGIYYIIILLLNTGLIIYLIYSNLKDKELIGALNIALWMAVVASMIFAVIYHCWKADYQPQGRYLFGVIPCLMYLVSRKKTYKCLKVEYLLESIALMSIYSFIKCGMFYFIS